MATSYDVIYLGTLPLIDSIQDNEVAENAAGILGGYGSADDPLSAHVQSLSADRLDEDDLASYDINNGTSYDAFRINGGAPQNFDAVATYNATITYADGSTADITAVVFQDVNGNTYLAPQATDNADQAALTAKPIMEMSLNSVADNTGDMVAERVDGDFKSSVDGTSGDDVIVLGYTDAQGDQVTTGDDYINGGDGNDTIHGDGGLDTIYGGDGDDYIQGGADDDLIYAGAGDDRVIITDRGDTVYGGDGSDFIKTEGSGYDKLVFGGEGGTDDDTLSWATETDAADVVNVTFTSDEAGTAAIRDQTVTFSEIENIEGTQGGDTIDAGASSADLGLFGEGGDDIITGGSGADSLDGGDGSDSFILRDGFGNDTITGGEGGTDSDTIDLSQLSGPVTVNYTGEEAGTITDGTDTITFSEVERLILTGHDDVVEMGSDSVGTFVDGGAGDDTFDSGAGTDTIIGGLGNDSLDVRYLSGTLSFDGGEGVDTIDWSNGPGEGIDITVTGAGDGSFGYATGSDGTFESVEIFQLTREIDTFDGSTATSDLKVVAGDGNDSVVGGSGNDTLFGGGDDDTLVGGAGDDLLIASTGNDEMTGGDGNDRFVYYAGDGNDTITDFNVGNTGSLYDGDTTNNDFIDLSDFYTNIDELRGDFDDDGILNQSVGDYSDNTSMAGGSLTFSGVDRSRFNADNTGVACFASGTAIRTPQGDVAIEDLRPGDLLCLWDGPPEAVIWAGHTDLTLMAGTIDASQTPVRIKPQGSQDQRALVVSPQHCMLMRLADGTTMFARARHLAEETALASYAPGRRSITYHHLLLARHRVLIAEGRPSESFYPGPHALKLMTPEARARVLAAASGLRMDDPRATYGRRAAVVLGRRNVRKLAAVGQLFFPDFPNVTQREDPPRFSVVEAS